MTLDIRPGPVSMGVAIRAATALSVSFLLPSCSWKDIPSTISSERRPRMMRPARRKSLSVIPSHESRGGPKSRKPIATAPAIATACTAVFFNSSSLKPLVRWINGAMLATGSMMTKIVTEEATKPAKRSAKAMLAIMEPGDLNLVEQFRLGAPAVKEGENSPRKKCARACHEDGQVDVDGDYE